MSKTIQCPNPHIAELETDVYYHLGLDSTQAKLFSKVRFVLFGGTNDRMKSVCQSVADAFWPLPLGQELAPIGSTARYHIYCAGKNHNEPEVLCLSHQMGMPSFSIMLHEVAKLLAAAEAKDVIFLRLGTSGGVGVAGGTVVITDTPLNGFLKPYYEVVSLGESIQREARLCPLVRQGLLAAAAKVGANAVVGNTMSVDCFYEGQGRLDGAICPYDNAAKMAFLDKAHAAGVRNIEMESAMFGAFCHKVGIRAGVVCCTLLNRREGDQVTMTPQQYKQWVGAVVETVKTFIAAELGLEYEGKAPQQE